MKSNKKEGKHRKKKKSATDKTSTNNTQLPKQQQPASSLPLSFPTHLLANRIDHGKKNNGSNTHYYDNNYNHNHATRSKNLMTLIPKSVFASKKFLSQNECDAFIQFAEHSIGFQALSSPQTRDYAQRECGRIQLNDDWTMAELLYERMKHLVEEIAETVVISKGNTNTNTNTKYRPICCNGNLRMYKYEKNMSFGRHYDGSNAIHRYPGGNTEITVLIYLSSCEGGATRFHLPCPPRQQKKSKTIASANGIAFVPEAGAILLHMHGDRCLEHEADPVVKGIKYILRTDIVYSNVSS